MQYVYCLCKIRHNNAVRVLVENIQIAGGYYSVTHGVLLEKETWIGAIFDFVPASPLVDNKTYRFLWIVTGHYLAVTGYNIVYIEGLFYRGVISFVRKFRRVAFFAPVAVGYRVVVQRNSFCVKVGQKTHQLVSPAVVTAAGAAGNLEQFIATEVFAE